MSILLVDDQPRLRRALARSLAAQGFQVAEAASWREAVTCATNTRFDLLVLDVNLPDATGWDVLRTLAARGRAIPTVVISGVPPSAGRLRKLRPFAVLHKPFPIEALQRLARAATAHRAPGVLAAARACPDDESATHLAAETPAISPEA